MKTSSIERTSFLSDNASRWLRRSHKPGTPDVPFYDFPAWARYLAISLLAAAFSWWAATHAIADRPDASPTIRAGFTEASPHVFRSVGGSQPSMHLLGIPTRLESSREYVIGFRVDERVPGDQLLTVDLFAPGYDNPEQDRHVRLTSLRRGSEVRVNINSGTAPANAFVRIFYEGLPGLEISRLTIAEGTPSLRWTSYLAGTVSLIAALAALWTSSRNSITAALRDRSARFVITRTSAIPVLLLIFVAATLIRYITYAITPYWSGDEYLYKSLAAAIWQLGTPHLLTADAIGDVVDLPNLLYPYYIAPAFVLGDDFYLGIRLLNSVAMAGVVFPVYLIARRFLARNDSLLLAAFAICIPFMWLGAFAVTEVLFYPLFVWSAWAAMNAIQRRQSIQWQLAFGLIAGALMNARPNGFVVVIVYVATLATVSIRRGSLRLLIYSPVWSVGVAAALLSYAAMRQLLGGNALAGLGIYGTVLKHSGIHADVLGDLAGIGKLVLGHLATLSIPYALPLAVVFASLRASPEADRQSTSDLHVYLDLVVALTFASLIVAIGYTIYVSADDLGGLARWHARYYFPVLPLILIAAAAVVRNNSSMIAERRMPVTILAVALLTANVIFIQTLRATTYRWFGSSVDNMEVQWYRHFPLLYWPVLGACCVLVLAFARNGCLSRRTVIGTLFAYALIANAGTAHELRSGKPHGQDECGRIASAYLHGQPGSFAVVADSRATRVATVFWIPTLPIQTIVPPPSAPPVDVASLMQRVDAVIVNGNPVIDATNLDPVVSAGNCRIYASHH